MGTITLKNFRTTADVTMNTRLKDGGMFIDWAGLTNIKAWLFSDAQKAIAGRCDVSINQADSTMLVCEYSASKPQYLGVNRLILQAKYQGRTKTYDVPAFNFVSRTAAATGSITIDEPTVDVCIEVTDTTSSILDAAIAAALAAAADAEHAAHLIPNQVLLDCEAATAVALTAATHAPTIGENGNWWVWNATLEAYEDTGNEAQGPTGNGIASWSVVESQEDAGSNVVTVMFTDGTSETFTYKNGHTGNGIASIVQTVVSPDDAGTNVITITMTNGTVVTFNVKNGSKGQPGAAQAAYKSVETLPTASAATMDKIYLTPSGTSGVYNMSYTDYDGSAYSWVSLGTTAIQLSDYATKTEVAQLEAEVHNMSNKFYGVFLSTADLPNDVTEPGYAYVGSSSPFAIYNFDGNTWTDSETTMDSMYGPSVNPFKGFFNSATDLNAAYPTPMTGQYAYVNQGGTPAVAHIYFSNGGVWSDSGVSVSGDQESDFTRFAKSLLIQTLSKVAWTDANAQAYLSALEDALINDIVVDHITAVFEPGSALITENTTLDELRQYLTVTVFYNNGTSEIVTTYTLAGTMSAGTQTITVDYLGTTDTFTVNVLGNYAESVDNWMYHPNNSVAQYDSRGYIVLKCSNNTDLNGFNCYVADIKKTLWSAVNGKTIKVRIKTNSTTDGLFGLGIYQNSSITSLAPDKTKRTGLPNLVLADDGYYEQTFVCDISNFTIGSLTPGTSATFGVWCYSRSTSVWSQIFDVQIFDVTP